MSTALDSAPSVRARSRAAAGLATEPGSTRWGCGSSRRSPPPRADPDSRSFAQPQQCVEPPSLARASTFSASCSSITRCADGAARTCARSTAVFSRRTAAISRTRRSAGGDGLVARYADQNASIAGVHTSQGVSREGQKSTGSCHVHDRDRSDPGTEVLREHRADVQCGLSPTGELPVDEKRLRPAPRAAGGDREAVVPPKIPVDEHVLVVGALGARSAGPIIGGVCLKPRYKILRPRAEVTDQLERRFRELERPHPLSRRQVDPRYRRGQWRCSAARPRPRARAGATGKRPALWCSLQSRPPPGERKTRSAMSRSSWTTAGTCPASSGASASIRSTAASCLSVSRTPRTGLLDHVGRTGARRRDEDAVAS